MAEPQDLLVIGGTSFVGRHLVEQALARGHRVTLLNRGRTGAELFPQARRLRADRDGDLSALDQGGWDATIDVCGYHPQQVTRLARALAGRGGRYCFISTISVYADPAGPGITEQAALQEPADPQVSEITRQTYGPLKVACELEAVARFDDPLVIRPTYVVGPWDPTGRFTYWVRRLAAGGDVVLPGPADQPIQCIDARDLAAWTLGLIERGAGGTFHAAAPAPPFSLAELVDQIAAAVAPAGTRIVPVDPAWLADQASPADSWPLWHGGEHAWVGAVDSSAAIAGGLRPRPVADTARDVLDHSDTPTVPGVGVEPERERAILRDWGHRSRA